MFFIVAPLLGYGKKKNSSAQNLIFWNASKDSLVMVTMMLVFFSRTQSWLDWGLEVLTLHVVLL